MPGPILHAGADVSCSHRGRATPLTPFPRVLVNGMPVATQPVPWGVTGCLQPPPNAGNGPCLTAVFTTAALRVFVNVAVPVLLADSVSTAAPTLTPLVPGILQTRVVAM